MPNLRPLLLLCFALIVLWTAYWFQYVRHLQPCELCLLQRWPWRVVIILSSLALLRPRWAAWVMPVCGLTLAGGAALALYHSGVEYHWWPGPDACAGTLGRITDPAAFVELLNRTNVVRCDQPAWTLFGISMAGYNGLVSAALAIWCLSPQRRQA